MEEYPDCAYQYHKEETEDKSKNEGTSVTCKQNKAEDEETSEPHK